MPLLRDLLAFCGVGLFLAGLYQYSEPLAYVAGGVILACVAGLWSWMARKEPR
jgi:hypothetical protein